MRFAIDQTIDLQCVNRIKRYEQPMECGDKGAHVWRVRVLDRKAQADLSASSAKCFVTRPASAAEKAQGYTQKTIEVDAQIDLEDAMVNCEFSEACYNGVGPVSCVMRIYDSDGGILSVAKMTAMLERRAGSPGNEPDIDGGESSSVNLQSKSVTPSETAQTVRPDGGYDGLSSVAVGAISKTYVGSSVPRKAAATITPGTSAQTIAAGQYLSGAQTIAGDSDLIPANIRSGVNIFGVTGAYAASGGTTEPVLQSKAVVPTADGFIVTADSGYDGLSQVTVGGDDDLIPANIRSGVNIFGVTGTYTASGGTAEPVLQEKTVTPTASGASITPDAGYDGLSAVYMKGDSDLVAQNIKSGVNIFGVTGTYTGSGSVGLPSGISALASGTFTPESDITSYHVVEHGLGVAPNFTYVMLMDALDEAIPNMLISMFEYGKSGLPKKMEYGQIVYYDSSGALIQSGTQAAIFDANSIYINATSSRTLKAGYTYRWVAGVMDGIA